MKKQLIAAALLLSCTTAYANIKAKEALVKEEAEDQSHRPSSVYLLSPHYTFEVNFTALLMQPTASNLDYAAEAIPLDFAIAVPPVSPNWVIHEIKPDYHFGFDLGIAGMFHSTNSNLAINWERFHSPRDSNSRTVPSTSMIGPFFEIGPDSSFYKSARGRVNFHFDAVNLDYGTFIHLGKRLRMNLFAGVGFANIVQHRQTTFSDFSGDTVRIITVPSKFIGAGPQLGLNFTCKVIEGLHFVGETRATVFAGRAKNKTTFSSMTPALEVIHCPNPNIQMTSVRNRSALIPGFEGKLGFAYSFESSHYMIKAEVGYRAQVYLNSIRSIDMGSQVTLSDVGTGVSGDMGVFARTFERTISDFSLAGPYFTIAAGF